MTKFLAGLEMVKKPPTLEKTLSVENGEMPPSFKVKRNVVKQRYAKEISEMAR